MVHIPVWALLAAILVVALAILVLLASSMAQRLNRMHVRCDLARASLEAALGRRAAVTRAAFPDLAGLAGAAEALPLTAAEPGPRADAENRLAAALSAALDEAGAAVPAPVALEVNDARTRVDLARRFYNDAVTDTRALRRRRLVRALRLAGTAPSPEYFDIVARPGS